jgi:hypothetical protein
MDVGEMGDAPNPAARRFFVERLEVARLVHRASAKPQTREAAAR